MNLRNDKSTSLNFSIRKNSNRLSSCNLMRELKETEKKLIKLVELRNNGNLSTIGSGKRFYEIYLKLGHINLLAEDFARALSAYQKSYKYNKDEFWMDSSALYGLALCYYHFRNYRPAIELFCQLLFSHPYCKVIPEVHARLGISFKAIDNFSRALKHLHIALDCEEEPYFPKHFLRFQIAHCFDVSGDVRRAVEEYRRLLTDYERSVVSLSSQLIAAIYSRLGWISLSSREREPREDIRNHKLKEAEGLLCRARDLSPADSKANCYLGLCYSEQTRVANKLLEEQPCGARYNADQAAQAAFVSYRTAIDSDESDANIWRSIGVLYQQQNQPIDALQAFACAVQLNEKHFGAWLDLGQLYERHRQYSEALRCYKRALNSTSEPPETLRLRCATLERELTQIGGSAHYSLLQQQFLSRRPPDPNILPSIEAASQLGIPLQVRQRLTELKNQQENKYREGPNQSYDMQEIANGFEGSEDRALTPTQRQILQILKMNKEMLELHETTLLNELEQRATDSDGGGQSTAEDHAIEERATTSADVTPSHMPPQSTVESPYASSAAAGTTFDPSHQQQHVVLPSSMLSPKEESQMHGDRGNQIEDAQHQRIQEGAVSSTSQPPELPNFSLLAPVNVPVTVSSGEIFEMCKKRIAKPDEYEPIFDENVPPPLQPLPSSTGLPKEKLLLKTPLIIVENQKDAGALELQQFCYSQPIALIHGLTLALKIDLSQFSTKTLIQTAADHEVEVRTQYRMPNYDVNLDQLGNPTWAIRSSKSFTTISRYGQYQAESFKHSLKEETEKLRQANPKLYAAQSISTPAFESQQTSSSSPVPAKKRKSAANTPTRPGNAVDDGLFKIIKFGTNVDLSDERKFFLQLKELNKLPPFCRISSASNLLSYLGHTVLGMNTVQLYLKVPGCRTPGHLENNCFASVNVNIGPGECEWFGVLYEYWPVIEKMCKERGIDFLRGAWWPNVTDLVKADIPFYRFTQKAGDVVWVSGGCVHWVQSTGWCNNVAWNVGPMTASQMEMALRAHEWNKLNSYQSLVPMQHLSWSLARDVRFSNQKLYNLIKNTLIRSLAYCQMLVDFVNVNFKSPIKKQQRQKGECAHYCHLCEVEVFNILFVKETGGKWKIFCVQCARRSGLEEHVVLQQYTFEELSGIFDRFQLYPAKASLIC